MPSTEPMRVILEIGQKRRVVAGALDWPGLDRWGTSEDDALAKLTAYLPRYAGVASRAGMTDTFDQAAKLQVVERVPGMTSTDFWGIAHVPSQIEREALSSEELERRLALLEAAWAYFQDVSTHASEELLLGPRGGGRSRDEIVRHVYGAERHLWWRKVGIREDDDVRLTPDELAVHRVRYLDAIRAYHAEGKPARKWPLRFLIRRTAQHAMDHAWEIEDRDLSI